MKSQDFRQNFVNKVTKTNGTKIKKGRRIRDFGIRAIEVLLKYLGKGSLAQESQIARRTSTWIIS